MLRNVLILTIAATCFAACTDSSTSSGDEKVVKVFPKYDAAIFGNNLMTRAEPTCQCQNTICSSSKTCPSGQSCSCTCTTNRLGATCTCTDCASATVNDLWLTQQQYDLWEDFYNILDEDATPAGGVSRDYVVDFMDAITNDDPEDLDIAHSALIASLPYLHSSTKTAINAFYIAYDLEDDPL